MCIKLNRPLYSKQLLENWSSYACEPRKGKAKIPVSAWTILTKVKIRHVQFCHLPLSGKFTIRIVKHLILLDVGCHSLDSKINWRAKATAWVGLHATAGLLASGWYGSRLWPKKKWSSASADLSSMWGWFLFFIFLFVEILYLFLVSPYF